MHAAFIPYGKYEWVKIFLNDMRAQKYIMPLTKGDEKKGIWIDGQLRILPFGIYEHIFPRESMDLVLTTLGFHLFDRYQIGKAKMAILRKLLKMKKAPKDFKTDKQYLWNKGKGIFGEDVVYTIPVGIKEDADRPDTTPGEFLGWTHEAI